MIRTLRGTVKQPRSFRRHQRDAPATTIARVNPERALPSRVGADQLASKEAGSTPPALCPCLGTGLAIRQRRDATLLAADSGGDRISAETTADWPRHRLEQREGRAVHASGPELQGSS